MESTVTRISTAETSALFEDVLNAGLDLQLKVTGRSMVPFLKGGEIITIKKVSCSSLRKGDLVFFKTSCGSPVLHRLINKERGHNNTFIFRTKGDALRSFDEPVSGDDVLGKVLKIEKVVSHGKTQSIDMESHVWRKINILIALTAIIKSKAYSATRRIYRIRQYFFP